VKATIEFQWWRLNEETESGTDEVLEHHKEALEETAVRLISEQAGEGYVEGVMHDDIRAGDDDGESGVSYRGYCKRQKADDSSDSQAVSPTIQATMKKLREVADAACDRAQASGVQGAINWGDLGVVEVRFCVNEEGEGVYDILIEEAAPGSSELMQYVTERIGGLCKPHGCEIRTEW